MHDRIASTMSLARVILDGLDDSREETPVRTASLRLILDTLLDLGAMSGSPLPTAKQVNVRAQVADTARRTVADHIASISSAQSENDDFFAERPSGISTRL